jgi:integrase/recombinase XerD
MRVHQLVVPGTGERSWTVVGEDGLPVEPVEDYLAHLAAIERSPNTVRAYAHSLALWSVYLEQRGVDWGGADVADVTGFVGWLRAPAENVIVLDASASRRSETTVNRHLAAVFGFYEHHARAGGSELAGKLVTWRRVSRGAYKPFLHHVSKGRPIPTRPIKLRAPKRIPKTLSSEQVHAIVGACTRARDRFLFALLAESGMRVGQALGLRHADVVSRACEIRVVPRTDNANGARAKTRAEHVIPVSAALIRLYSDYLHTEYGDLDSDYVFVNLFAEPVGHPMSYPAVYALVRRIRAATGIFFTPHMLRHSHATELIRAGVPIEVVSKRLTHRSVTTTSEAYVHLLAEDVRDALVGAGVWDEQVAAR